MAVRQIYLCTRAGKSISFKRQVGLDFYITSIPFLSLTNAGMRNVEVQPRPEFTKVLICFQLANQQRFTQSSKGVPTQSCSAQTSLSIGQHTSSSCRHESWAPKRCRPTAAGSAPQILPLVPLNCMRPYRAKISYDADCSLTARQCSLRTQQPWLFHIICLPPCASLCYLAIVLQCAESALKPESCPVVLE